ncbi:MAG: restriction endonuclease, partial [Ruminococcaceae bacterium]|nr:restriction endonuclease [Oscillospiraceae bacterium]
MEKINRKEIAEVNNKILNAIKDEKKDPSNSLRKAFYFKGRKSNLIAKKVIEEFTEETDLVLDPFFGGGSFILASLEANRFVEGIELDSYTYSIFKTLMTKVEEKLLANYFGIIENNVKENVMKLYRTKCCGVENCFSKLLFDPEDGEYYEPIRNREFEDGKNVKLIEKCPVCGCKSKKFDDYDMEVLESTLKLDNSRFPTDKYIENSRINITSSTGADKYERNFSERNKQALLIIQSEINKLPKSKEKNFIQHALVSSLALAKTSMYGSSTDILYHVIREQGQEMNVWLLFEAKFKSMIKFQEEYANYLVKDINNNNIMKLTNASYSILKNTGKKYDMIYTDFPYTDQVPYLERNQLFRIWLENFSDKKFELTDSMLEEEIVLTNAPSRISKNKIDNYYYDLDKVFF